MANLGDCRAVLCRAGAAVDLTADCKAARPDEVARVVDAGGLVSNGRIHGETEVSRSFGDSKYKAKGKEWVSSKPELTEVKPYFYMNVFSAGVREHSQCLAYICLQCCAWCA
jgi:serine/threonine protein phosphatase PrpC